MSNSVLGDIDNEAHTVYPSNPRLCFGGEFHSCEHCKDFTLDFGLTDGELDKMVRNRVDSLKAKGCTTIIMKKLERLRKERGELAILSDTKVQVARKANAGCQFYAFLSLSYSKSDMLCAVLNSKFSKLEIRNVSSPLRYIRTAPVVVPQDSPLAKSIGNRPTAVDPWSKFTKAQVAQWMEDCADTHELFQNEEHFFSPTYLIELSPCMSKCPLECPSDCCGFTLRLKKDVQGPVSYAALSYCWGGDQKFKTTKSNIRNLLHNIRYVDMPATLKDAAKVAFDLNFQFLWIDALCLIQDPGEDEIHTMIAEIPNIYRHATLTIAAKSSNSVNEGFLHPRHMKDCRVVGQSSAPEGRYRFQIAIQNLFGKSGFAMVRNNNLTDKFAVPIIETRGWTLQEQVLSKGYLSFSNIATQWQFYGSSSDEGYLADGGEISEWPTILDSISSKWKSLQFSKSPKTTQKHGQLWLELVAEYTRRYLSIHKDRPIAISALASDLGDANDYVAGLWLSNLCHGLSWVSHESQNSSVVGYYTPSWSWWSAEGKINWPVTTESDMHQEPRFQLVEPYSKLAHPAAPFGYLLQASLRVEARCGEVLVSDHQRGEYLDTLRFEYGTSGYVRLNSYHSLKEDIIFDRWFKTRLEGQVLRLLILFVSKKEITRIFGLILTGVTNDGSEQDRKYCRIGVFDLSGQVGDELRIFLEWLREQPVETLTLV